MAGIKAGLRKAMQVLKDRTPFDAITLDLHLPGVPGTDIVMNLTIGIEEGLTVGRGDTITTSVEKLIYDSFPSVLRVHVHYHPADKQHENMTIDQILSEDRQHVSPYRSEYYK